jgi:hypothetical protein
MPWLTTITLKVLSQDEIPDEMTPADVCREAVEGDYSWRYDWETELIDDDECKTLLVEQGSDISFFYPEAEGEADEPKSTPQS